jgi:hypothetical protein
MISALKKPMEPQDFKAKNYELIIRILLLKVLWNWTLISTERGKTYTPDQMSLFEVSFFFRLFDEKDFQLVVDVLSEHRRQHKRHFQGENTSDS